MQTQSINPINPINAAPQQNDAVEIFKAIALICPIPDGSTSDIITVVIDEKHSLGKRFSVAPDGAIQKTAAVSVSRGIACQYHVPDHATLESMLRIVSDCPHAAIINAGWKPAAIGEPFIFLSMKALVEKGCPEEAVATDGDLKAFARLKHHATPSTWQLLDRDEDKFTPDWAKTQSFADWCVTLDKILPGAGTTKKLRAQSSSARVLRPDGHAVGDGNGHVWIKIKDAADAERTRTAIMARALELGLSWTKPRVSKTTGLECGRGHATIIDPSVFTMGRLVFVGCPTASKELTVTPQQFEFVDGKDDALDTRAATFSVLKTFLASVKQGVKLRLTATKKASGTTKLYNASEASLTLDTEIELEDGSLTNVRKLMAIYTGKIRCQAPFRASSSMAAFFALDKNGEPFVFDSGTATHHTLAQSKVARKADADRERLVMEVRGRLELLIGADNAEAVFDDDVLRAAWDATLFSPINSKINVLNENSNLIDLPVKDFVDFAFRRIFGSIYRSDFLEEVISELKLATNEEKEFRKRLHTLEYGPLIEMLKLLKQAKSMDISVDIFSESGSMTVRDGIATVALPHCRLAPEQVFDKDLIDQVMADYWQHFPEFRDFLDLVLHSRFASDRRHAFVWLHSASSWGKGFLVAIFAKLGLVVDVSTSEIDKALGGSPVGLSMHNMLRTWIMFVDEFKAASSELKLLNTQITLASKNQLRCTVQLYTKLFASAESVRSLVGDGVESQFNNRFSYLSPSTHEEKIEDRRLFKDLGKAVYIGAVGNFVAEYLNAGVDRLKSLGPVEASKVADSFLADYQAARRLQSIFGNLDDAIDDIVDEIRRCLIEYGKWKMSNNDNPPDIVRGVGAVLLATLMRTTLIGEISVGAGSRQRYAGIVLGEPEKFIKAYLSLSSDRSTIGKLQYKIDTIAAKVHMRLETYAGSTRVRVYNGVDALLGEKRGVVVFLTHRPTVPVCNSLTSDVQP